MSPRLYPVIFEWDDVDEVMRPTEAFVRLARRQYVGGEWYRLENHEERSTASHRSYHAEVREHWKRLPAAKIAIYKTPDHLRQWALIKLHYCDVRIIDAVSPKQAMIIAAVIRPMMEFAVVIVRGSQVFIYTAQSQSYRAMNKQQFEESSHKVLELLAQVGPEGPEKEQGQIQNKAAPLQLEHKKD